MTFNKGKDIVSALLHIFGLGLSIARSIAEAHKGSIRAECPDANSIRFTVVLR